MRRAGKPGRFIVAPQTRVTSIIRDAVLATLHNLGKDETDVYTITSFYKKPVGLLVLEASPVSTSEEIRVQTSGKMPPTLGTWKRRRGVVGWETVIAPNQALQYNVDDAITYPKECIVVGLP